METDKELLELAAKAIGLTLWKNHADAFLLFDGPHLEGDGKFVCFWNPLTDDGDALRLAVMLNLEVMFYTEHVGICHNARYVEREDFNPSNIYSKSAATRRAIVRAAAEIGRNMP